MDILSTLEKAKINSLPPNPSGSMSKLLSFCQQYFPFRSGKQRWGPDCRDPVTRGLGLSHCR